MFKITGKHDIFNFRLLRFSNTPSLTQKILSNYDLIQINYLMYLNMQKIYYKLHILNCNIINLQPTTGIQRYITENLYDKSIHLLYSEQLTSADFK